MAQLKIKISNKVCYFGEKSCQAFSTHLKKNLKQGPLLSYSSLYKFPAVLPAYKLQKIQPTSNLVWQMQHLILEAFNN